MVLVETVRDRLDPQARSWALGATMFTIFGLLALAVAAVGLYSVLAFDVAQRTREIGIRTALGAQKVRVLRAVVSQGALMGALGVALGLAVAYFAAPYIQDLLFETSPRDATVFVSVAVVLLAVSVAASLVPALRATRVDPVSALKAD
jgi:ABC-type antimicrobial peptide transport system permease subunit